MGSLAGATIGKDAHVWNCIRATALLLALCGAVALMHFLPDDLRYGGYGIRAIALLLALCGAVALTHFLPDDLRYGGYGVVGLLLLGPLVAMPRTGWFLLPLLWAGREALRYANAAKISLTQVPLTSRDLRLALNDPLGLLDALQVPVLLRQAALALAAMALAWLLWQAGCGALVAFRERGQLAVHAAVVGAVLAYAWCFAAYLDGFVARADAYARQAGGRWDPQLMAELPRELGLEGFLAYSLVLERAHHGPFFERHGPLRPDWSRSGRRPRATSSGRPRGRSPTSCWSSRNPRSTRTSPSASPGRCASACSGPATG
jgi:hypothetical protein